MRPMPPSDLTDPLAPLTFRASAELERWVRDAFIEEGSALENPAHQHLRHAKLGFLWTNVPMKRRGMTYLGTCEMPTETAATWAKARGEFQIRRWFDEAPNFLITLYAPAWADMSDRQAFALAEHELLHAAQARDEFGQPSFNRQTGEPKWAMREHDFQEFVGVVERYGATSAALRTAAESIMAGPLLSDEEISIACGACA